MHTNICTKQEQEGTALAYCYLGPPPGAPRLGAEVPDSRNKNRHQAETGAKQKIGAKQKQVPDRNRRQTKIGAKQK